MIVRFAHRIGKNTAYFTAYDLQKYIDWLWKQDEERKEESMSKKVDKKNDKKEEEYSLTVTKSELEVLIFAIESFLSDFDVADDDLEAELRKILESLKSVLNFED